MTKRKSATTRREDRAKRSAYLILAIIGTILLVVAGLYSKIYFARKSLNEVTLCPAESASLTILLVDVTDAMNVAQRQDFLNQLERLKNSIPRYGKLIVMKVDATAQHLLTPIIERGNPGTSRDEDDVTGNPARLQRLWDEQFDKPLDRAFEQILIASGADASPIIESIQSATLTEFQKQAAEGKPRRLIVASDLLQNTADVSFYRGLPDPTIFIESPSFQRSRTNLRGIDVELWMLQRLDSRHTQPRALPDLWDRIITRQGGNLDRIYTVSG